MQAEQGEGGYLNIVCQPAELATKSIILEKFYLALTNYVRWKTYKQREDLFAVKANLLALDILLKPIDGKDLQKEITASDESKIEEILKAFSQRLHDIGITKIERVLESTEEEYYGSITKQYTPE